MYAVYHGPSGIRRIADRVYRLARRFAEGVRRLGYETAHDAFFDTVAVNVDADRLPKILGAALEQKINLRRISATRLGLAFDETTTDADLSDLLQVFNLGRPLKFDLADVAGNDDRIPARERRASPYLTHAVFHRYRSETEMLRYLKRLEAKDLSLTAAMIPLGSCTMKLNATTEMMPITWAGFAGLHPFAPRDQAAGYTALFETLEAQLTEITGLAAVSLQPNAGSQGEFCGLLTIRAYHREGGDPERTTCLIPQSAHGTNPASAVMAGMKVVAVKTDAEGNIAIDDLRAKAEKHRETLGALMVTYPSTHGVFEAGIREVCDIIHTNGGQVYMDGANLNAQVGLCRPGDIGADVCHLNLHKTFCIPHGGGGPGMGPIAVAAHLERHLPDHPVVPLGQEAPCGTISAAPWGSPSILPISWAYLALMGPDGLTEATRIAILNANYVAHRLKDHFPLLYSGAAGLIAHECILDTRPFKRSAEVDVEDVAKRLIDFSFHPPTVSFPVPGTLMVEPTESEPKTELDRFCNAMIAIREEIREIEDGRAERGNNILTHAPHTIADVCADTWDRPYSRERAGLPTPETREHKVWPPVGRVDSAYGDRHLICSCPPMEAYEDA
jgi:glycine dehydrogenase